MLGELEDLAAVGALAFEHGAAIVECVSQDMDVGRPPRYELAIEPDRTIAIVIRNDLGHEQILVG